jgi:hypothetical protein
MVQDKVKWWFFCEHGDELSGSIQAVNFLCKLVLICEEIPCAIEFVG